LKTDAGDEALVRRVLLKQPGIAAVEELRVERRWGRMRSVTVCISIHGGADARDVCHRAAQALVERLRVVDVCLVTAAAPGEAVSREETK
jgi:hypothetical protein